MFVTTHAAIGALIASQFPGHPYIAFFLAVASHFLSDIIPHGDTHLYKGYVAGFKVKRALAYVLVDSIVAMFLTMYVLNSDIFVDRRTVTIGIIAGVLPDFLVGVYELFKFKWLKWFHRVHFFFHNMVTEHRDLSFRSGFVMQVVVLGALLYNLM